MPDHATLTSFLGWSLLIHLVIFLIGLLKITTLQPLARRIGTAILGEDTAEEMISLIPMALIGYWVLIMVFNLVPYLVLRLFIGA